jgi:RimJ/RimL family protein N-acetyltransferase
MSAIETDVWSPFPVGLSEADWARLLSAPNSPADLTFVMEFASDNGMHPVGVIALGAFDLNNRVAEVTGYWIHPDFRGRSIAPTGIRLVTDWAMICLGFSRVQIFTRPDNVSSQRAARKAGFTLEGVLRSFVQVAGERSDAVVLSRISTDKTPPGDSQPDGPGNPGPREI